MSEIDWDDLLGLPRSSGGLCTDAGVLNSDYEPNFDFLFPFVNVVGGDDSSSFDMAAIRSASATAAASLNTPDDAVAGPAPKGDDPKGDGGDNRGGDGDWLAVPPCDRCALDEVQCWMPSRKQAKVKKCQHCRESPARWKCSLSGE